MRTVRTEDAWVRAGGRRSEYRSMPPEHRRLVAELYRGGVDLDDRRWLIRKTGFSNPVTDQEILGMAFDRLPADATMDFIRSLIEA